MSRVYYQVCCYDKESVTAGCSEFKTLDEAEAAFRKYVKEMRERGNFDEVRLEKVTILKIATR